MDFIKKAAGDINIPQGNWPGIFGEKTEKKLTEAQQREYDKESEQIRENQKTERAKRPHRFIAAKWTFPNGHSRCLICGDEPRIPRPGETPDKDNNGKCDGLDSK